MTPPEPFYILCPSCGAPHRSWSRSGNTYGATTLWSDGVVTSVMLPPPDPIVARCARCAVYFWLDAAQRLFPREGDDPEAVLHITEVGPERAGVIRALRAALGVPMGEAKRLVDAGRPFNPDAPRSVVDELRDRLCTLGAKVTLRARDGRIGDEGLDVAPNVAAPTEAFLLDALDAGAAPTRPHEIALRVSAWRLGNDPYRGTGRAFVRYGDRTARVRESLERLVDVLSLEVPEECVLRGECARQLERFDEARSLLTAALPLEVQRRAGILRALAGVRDPTLSVVWTRR
jgi:ribosomal protein L7/L12